MDGAITWLIAMKPFWFLAAWLASSVFAAFVALEKNRCGFCWFAMGILFGPLALLATAGLPVKPPRPLAGAKPVTPETHAHAQNHAPSHAPVHAPLHPPLHPPVHAPAHPPSHAPLGHAAAAHAPYPPGVHPPPLSPGHPAPPAVTHAAAHLSTGHHAEPAHAPAKQGLLASAMDRPGAGIAVAAIVILLLLIYFGSRHM